MIPKPREQRSQGPLIAFIDLLFLLVAFFTLLLFFIQQERTVAQEELVQTQEQLEELEQERTTVDAVIESLEPFMEQLASLREAKDEKRRHEDAKARRRAIRDRVRIEYEVDRDGAILYKDRKISLDLFVTQVVEPTRKRHWITFRGFAHPDTPFGKVVESRRRLLENQAEFDTYWDNLTPTR